MKNGLNVAASSEFMHELRTNPEEGILEFQVVAWRYLGATVVQTKALRAGTITIARDFAVPLAFEDRELGPTALEYFLLGVGGCTLFTWMHDLRVKDVAVQSARLDISRSGESELDYHISFDCIAPHELLRDTAEKVPCFSPVHRTVTDSNRIDVNCLARRLAREGMSARLSSSLCHLGDPEPPCDRARASLTWVYGPHFEARTNVRSSIAASSWTIQVDQPKQFMGLDRAPNPEEYLLIGLAGEVMRIACETCVPVAPQYVSVKAKIDLRGFYNLGRQHPAAMHALQADIVFQGGAEDQTALSREYRSRISTALSASPVAKLLSDPSTLRFTVSNHGQEVVRSTTNKDSVEAAHRRFSAPRVAKPAS